MGVKDILIRGMAEIAAAKGEKALANRKSNRVSASTYEQPAASPMGKAAGLIASAVQPKAMKAPKASKFGKFTFAQPKKIK